VWRRIGPTSFITGLYMGALASSFIALTLGLLIRETWASLRIAVVCVTSILVLVDAFGQRSIPFPANNRQVPQSVQHREPQLGALLFGFEMGTGMRTFSPTGLPHLGLVAAICVAPIGAIPLAIGFATGRSAMLLGALNDPEPWLNGWEDRRRLHLILLTVAVVVLVGVLTLEVLR
jgi:hypothetical protein